jgi:hypothetical protein
LLVASQDDRKAFRDVPASIRALFQLEYGLECAVTQKVGYSEFVQWVALFERASVSDLSEKPLGEALEYISFTLYPVSEREQDGHV